MFSFIEYRVFLAIGNRLAGKRSSRQRILQSSLLFTGTLEAVTIPSESHGLLNRTAGTDAAVIFFYYRAFPDGAEGEFLLSSSCVGRAFPADTYLIKLINFCLHLCRRHFAHFLHHLFKCFLSFFWRMLPSLLLFKLVILIVNINCFP